MEELTKTVQESLTEQIQIVMPEQINGFQRLFGGKLVEWMDIVAAVAARRHSNRNVTTACIDDLQFMAPAYVNDTMVLRAKLTSVGNSSMEVRVDAFTESLDGTRKTVNTAYFTMVALDEQEKPVRVPRLKVETAEEKADWEQAMRRREQRKK